MGKLLTAGGGTAAILAAANWHAAMFLTADLALALLFACWLLSSDKRVARTKTLLTALRRPSARGQALTVSARKGKPPGRQPVTAGNRQQSRPGTTAATPSSGTAESLSQVPCPDTQELLTPDGLSPMRTRP
jgi:hypothetical protein